MAELKDENQIDSKSGQAVENPIITEKVTGGFIINRIKNFISERVDIKRAAACIMGVVAITGSVYYYSHGVQESLPVQTLMKADDTAQIMVAAEEVKSTYYSIAINGEEVGYVASEEDANKVIEGIKAYNKEQEASSGAEVLNVVIKDDIKITPVEIEFSKVMDSRTMLDTLMAGKGVTKKYEVKSGDSIWRISRNNDMSVEEVAAVNPGIDLEKLQIGQMINLAVSEPYVNVETTIKAQYDEKIPYTTKYVDDGNLYKGQTKVIESGESGIKRLVKEITKLNGKEILSNVISSAVVKNPAVRVMARGTKALVGSGKFQWPLGGRVTSGFGSRSGGYHKGLDIAAPIGSPIYAADGGTVTLAERYYGYGKMVMIDHGNGYVTYYGHCSTLFVTKGQTVSRGQKIAAVGMTGDTSGPHLHFEVRLNGSAQNPIKYLK